MAFYFVTTILFTAAICAGEFSEERKLESVVLKGAQLPDLTNVPIDFIVGFAYSSAQWEQIPLQIDEMHWQDWDVIKNSSDCRIAGRNATELVYADSKTLSGPDENPRFDADDELVFMARYMGRKRPAQSAFPPNVLQVSIRELSIEAKKARFLVLAKGHFFFAVSVSGGDSHRPNRWWPRIRLSLSKRL